MRVLQILLVGLLIGLAGCDVDLFGSDVKKLAGGYKLKKVDGFYRFEYELLAPGKDEGEYVAQIGWRKPFILVRFRENQNWNVIDTSAKRYTPISDDDRRTEASYREIQIYFAEPAWELLSGRYRLWR